MSREQDSGQNHNIEHVKNLKFGNIQTFENATDKSALHA